MQVDNKSYICPYCKGTFSAELGYFSKRKTKTGEIRSCFSSCKECAKKRSKASVERNKEKVKLYKKEWYEKHKVLTPRSKSPYISQQQRYLYKTYKLTLEERLLLPKYCECCGATEELARLCVDHSHVTGKIRGILCHNCNTALGLLQDNPETIEKLKNYIINRN